MRILLTPLVYYFSSVALTGGSSVQGNTAGQSAGGLMLNYEGNLIDSSGSSVDSNSAGVLGGGLAVVDISDVTVDGGSSVQRNRVLNGSGGGLSVSGASSATISNHSTISNNKCWGGIGGGIAVEMVMLYTKVGGNTTEVLMQYDAHGHPAVGAEDVLRVAELASDVTISNSIVSNYTCVQSLGGGLAVSQDGSLQLVNGSVVSLNSAVNSSGGGVVLFGNGALRADDSVMFVNNIVRNGYVGSTIAAFDNSSLELGPGGRLTKCSVGVYLGWSTCQAGETQQHDMCVCCLQHTFSFTNASCEPCPINGNCTGGSLVQPLPGCWLSAPTSVQMHRCPLYTTACNYTSPTQQCNEGYTGPLCGACQLPQYGMLSPFRCGKCLPPKVAAWVVPVAELCSCGLHHSHRVHHLEG
jgi:hypothetical protein